jgi:hypothetical protein
MFVMNFNDVGNTAFRKVTAIKIIAGRSRVKKKRRMSRIIFSRESTVWKISTLCIRIFMYGKRKVRGDFGFYVIYPTPLCEDSKKPHSTASYPSLDGILRPLQLPAPAN